MNRLRDQQGAEDPTLARAAALLQAAQPAIADEAMRARVWQAVLARRCGRTRRARTGLAVLLLGGGLALAAHPRVGELLRDAVGWIKPRPETTTTRDTTRDMDTTTTTTATTTTTTQTTPTTDPQPAQPPHTRLTKPPRPAAALLQEAVLALRTEDDPARAGGLAEQYLARFPDGSLAEEAFSIAIEAARTQSNGRDAALTARYLERFPNGRFAEALRRAEPR
jgi:hypothetical protein